MENGLTLKLIGLFFFLLPTTWEGFGGRTTIISKPLLIRPPKLFRIILLHEKFLQFDLLRAVVLQLNLKYLHVKITNLLRVEV